MNFKLHAPFQPMGDQPEAIRGLVDGINNGFASGEQTRSFEVVLPNNYTDSQNWPLLFIWHGLGGDIASMLDGAGLREWANTAGMILVAPQALDQGGTAAWDTLGDARNADLALFDDLLTCSSKQWAVDSSRIYTLGMSDGGLFTGLLIAHRSSVLAAAAPFSGGILIDLDPDFTPLPVQVSWGGPNDTADGQNFQTLAEAMIQDLQSENSFVIQCNHGLEHNLSPDFWPWTFQFFQDHPQGVSPEPYQTELPSLYPDYCSL